MPFGISVTGAFQGVIFRDSSQLIVRKRLFYKENNVLGTCFFEPGGGEFEFPRANAGQDVADILFEVTDDKALPQATSDRARCAYQ